MTYGDIIEWIEQNYDFEPDEDVREAFNTISRDWKEDNRDTLANVLGDQKGDVIEGIRELISGSELEPETEEDFDELESRVERIDRELDNLFTEFGQIIRGRESIVLPKGFKVIEPDSITREFIESFEPEQSILTKVVNFFKGLFR